MTGALAKLAKLSDAVQEESSELVFQAADQGADYMRELIKGRGTAFSARAAATGLNKGPGRVRTGRMLRAVDRQVQRGAAKAFAAFGWLRDYELYFKFQEEGFLNRWSFGGAEPTAANLGKLRLKARENSSRTEGMFALRDSRTHVRDVVVPKLAGQFTARVKRRVGK